MTTTNFVLVRSDAGDGGWSLHPPGYTPEQIAEGYAPWLVTGTAKMQSDGEWDRPNANDYASAARVWEMSQILLATRARQ